MSIKIGDFVTSYEAGYWQLIDIKPKIADEDYCGSTAKWEKGDIIGQWAVLKKAFTPKMKPRIDFSYVDASWLTPVSSEVLKEIQDYFAESSEYKCKFENTTIKLRPMITNCWITSLKVRLPSYKGSLTSFLLSLPWMNFGKRQRNSKIISLHHLQAI